MILPNYVSQVDQLGWLVPSTYNLYDAKTRLSELVDRAAAGEEIVIAKNGRPLARLGPVPAEKPNRTPGGWEGMVWVADDFDASLDDELQRYFDGQGDGASG
jgi:prevent-host-death family protein